MSALVSKPSQYAEQSPRQHAPGKFHGIRDGMEGHWLEERSWAWHGNLAFVCQYGGKCCRSTVHEDGPSGPAVKQMHYL